MIYIFSLKLMRPGIFIVKKRCKQKIKRIQSGKSQEVAEYDDDDGGGGVVTCTDAGDC